MDRSQCERDCLLNWHYGTGWRRWDDIKPTHTVRDWLEVPAPFNNQIWTPGNCQIWRGSLHNGYGPHRETWETRYGPIPAGQSVLHRCHRRSCIQPAHLHLGDHKDNRNDLEASRGHLSSRQYLQDLYDDMDWFPREVADWWQSYWMAGSIPDDWFVPDAAQCLHHHWSPKMWSHDSRYCVLCKAGEGSEYASGWWALGPLMLSEHSEDPITPRTLTYDARLKSKRMALARELFERIPKFPLVIWDDIESYDDDREAVQHLGIILAKFQEGADNGTGETLGRRGRGR